MCGRFTLRSQPDELVEFFGLPELSTVEREALITPRANICPTELVAAVRQTDEGRRLAFFRWGLIPSWAEDAKISASLINARSETAATKPAFRTAFKRRRCLVPADGFYEWEKVGKQRIPFHIAPLAGGLMAIAGLWEVWHDPEERRVESCTLLTTTAVEPITRLHDRMPVFLAPDAFDLWLDPAVQDEERLAGLLRPWAKELSLAMVDPAVFARPTVAKPKAAKPKRSNAASPKTPPTDRQRRLFDE